MRATLRSTAIHRCRTFLSLSAAARAGKSVLQLDAAPAFGGPWGTLSLDDFLAWAAREPEANGAPRPALETGDVALPASTGAPPPGATLHIDHAALDALLPPGSEARRAVSVDRAPCLMHAESPTIDALLAHGATPYIEFKLAGCMACVAGGGEGGETPQPPPFLARLPATRADVFADRSLPPLAKRALMRFLTAAADVALAGEGPLAGALLDPRAPFAAAVAAAGLARPAADAVLYGLAAATADQGPWEVGAAAGEGQASAPKEPALPPPPPLDPATECELVGHRLAPWAAAPLPARSATHALRRHLLSTGRYGPSPLLLPVHGGGELPQAFVRAAAVAGGVAALRRGVVAVRVGAACGAATSVVLADGQRIACGALIAPEGVVEPLRRQARADGDIPPPAVARCAALLTAPPSGSTQSSPIVLPPRCLGGGRPAAPVHGVVLGSTAAAAPAPLCVLHLATPASGAGAEADLGDALAFLADAMWVEGGERGGGGPARAAAVAAAFFSSPPPSSSQSGLPPNVAATSPPCAGAATADGGVASAAAALARVFGAAVLLLPPRPDAAPGDASDEEAATALEAALAGLLQVGGGGGAL
jgi:RAB protein geranylgeranyltransferase component A